MQISGRGAGGNPATLMAFLDKHAGQSATACHRRRCIDSPVHTHPVLDPVLHHSTRLLAESPGPKPTRPRWQGLLVKAAVAVAAAAAVGLAITQRGGQTSESKAAALDDQLKVVCLCWWLPPRLLSLLSTQHVL